nr:hypothetical protein [uncultured Flavobacterium sp.]
MKNIELKIVLFIVVSAVIIGYPFFTIRYFETFTALSLASKYFVVPVTLILIIFSPAFYFKKIKPLDIEKPSKTKDYFSIIMMIFLLSLITLGVGFSAIITTNKWFGAKEQIIIKQPVIRYSESTTRNGRIRHYIDFEDPKTHDTVRQLEVYRNYNEGEIFEKKMYYGAWGILYASD